MNEIVSEALIQIDNFLSVIEHLEKEGLPIPIMTCQCCGGGTIFRKGSWFQCDVCGALSTQYGGTFPSEKNEGWSIECDRSRQKMKELLWKQ